MRNVRQGADDLNMQLKICWRLCNIELRKKLSDAGIVR